MREPWFFAPPEAWTADEVRLPPDEAHHAVAVLRVAAPDIITVADGRGTVARCSVETIADDRVVARVLDRRPRPRPQPEVVLYQGAAKGAKIDAVVERLAELGVAETWIYASERSVVRWDRSKLHRLSERWTAIARSAMKQSRNGYVMATGGGLSFTELIRRVAKEPLAVILWENASLPMRTALVERPQRVALVVGPEGGLTDAEADALADAGGQLVSLGPMILRTENAPVVAASALLYHYGLLG